MCRAGVYCLKRGATQCLHCVAAAASSAARITRSKGMPLSEHSPLAFLPAAFPGQHCQCLGSDIDSIRKNAPPRKDTRHPYAASPSSLTHALLLLLTDGS